MENIEKIKQAEKKADSLVKKAQKKAEESIKKTQEEIDNDLNNLKDKLKKEIETIIQKGKEEAKKIEKDEEKRRSLLLEKIKQESTKNIDKAVDFVYKKIVK